MKVSEVINQTIVDYLRLEEGQYEDDVITAYRLAAVSFIKSYTGLTEEEIDEHEDIYIVVLILCQDMNDNRSMYVDKTAMNKTVETILNMHRVNLIS